MRDNAFAGKSRQGGGEDDVPAQGVGSAEEGVLLQTAAVLFPIQTEARQIHHHPVHSREGECRAVPTQSLHTMSTATMQVKVF